jgi:hypothetical protein
MTISEKNLVEQVYETILNQSLGIETCVAPTSLPDNADTSQ